ncbi:hypothetical protein CVT24_002821 [Panaeolus cyanescens]|uniref:DUF6593 domain-containing protein n=1 Tax=Panaeolus cyanescens TaxID=181874 RepID=A0A409YRF8_9AGAR|nr:hypothetical protein CVT24_002821 [Panaeolus cyanescens]
MLLTLDTNNPWDATYTDESGRVIYRCEASSAFTLSNRQFKLYRAIPPTGQMQLVGQVDYDSWSRTKSKISLVGSGAGTEVLGGEARDLFAKTGSRWARYGRAQTFTAPDGRAYTWMFGNRSCTLHQSHASNIGTDPSRPVVKFKQRSLRLFSKSRPAEIEVATGYEGLLDVFLLTLIFLEKVKREKERQRRNAASIGGDAGAGGDAGGGGGGGGDGGGGGGGGA